MLPRRHEVDVAVRARELLGHAAWGVEFDGNATEDPERDVRRLGSDDHATRLGGDVRLNRSHLGKR
jgi:hypothetical protein